jgi:hypothetical protein
MRKIRLIPQGSRALHLNVFKQPPFYIRLPKPTPRRHDKIFDLKSE